jgi:hypothetical protein
MRAPSKASPGPFRPEVGVVSSSSPFQGISEGDEDIATPYPFPVGAVSGGPPCEIPKSEI